MRNGIDLHGYQVEWNEKEEVLIGATTATDGTRRVGNGTELASRQRLTGITLRLSKRKSRTALVNSQT